MLDHVDARPEVIDTIRTARMSSKYYTLCGLYAFGKTVLQNTPDLTYGRGTCQSCP